MKTKLYSIQGIIFQAGHVYDLANKPNIGTAVTIKEAMTLALYHGIVGPSEDEKDVYVGSMNDRWGESGITNFRLTKTDLQFTKQYKGRPIIKYSFKKKEGNIWIGSYSGEDCGTGESKCVIAEIDTSFFEWK